MSLNKPELGRCLKLLSDGFSLMTVGDSKTPNFLWKKYQTEQITSDEFQKYYNYSGGIIKKDGFEIQPSVGVGIITGFDNLECIDIDLKVLPNRQVRDDFWNEYLSLLEDNIDQFHEKFIITKTANFGYHIIYKCKEIARNVKISVSKYGKEALIESRGEGGYIWVYDSFLNGKNYHDVQEISIEDREILWQCSKIFDEKPFEKPEKQIARIYPEQESTGLSTWEDFNHKNSVWDIVRDEFSIVRSLSNKTVIKRNGATSPHSGYIFNNNGFMYLFSTGTQYPNEKLITPFTAYAYQKCFGDFSRAAKELYKEGYGARIKPTATIIPEHVRKIETDEFPIDIFPKDIQNYIVEVKETLNASIDYLGSSFLWAISLAVGNAVKLEVKKGWVEAGVLWIAIVGHAGIGKTHNINAMIKPLNDINARKIKEYKDKKTQYDYYQSLGKKEKDNTIEVPEPKISQFIVGDITMEALMEYHDQNKNAIGIYRDELSGWFKDMNKYRAGSDVENFLSSWSNQQMVLTRKQSKSAYVKNAFIPILGGIQPSILTNNSTEENKENGFLDRWLLCYPDLKVEKYNRKEMDQSTIDWYSDFLVGFYDMIQNNLIKHDEFGNMQPFKCRMSKKADDLWEKIFNKTTDIQNSDNESEYMKSILPKQKSYVLRFALLLNMIYCYYESTDPDLISLKAMQSAEKLSDYFIKMAKKNKGESMESNEIKKAIKVNQNSSVKDQFVSIYNANPNINKSKIASEFNVSRKTIYEWINEIKV